jgi:hypothetical protein
MKTVNLKMQAILSNAKKIGVIIVALSIGFVIGMFHNRIQKSENEVVKIDPKAIHRLKETSVAINERDEVMIINRTDGTYEIYEDSIGKTIFRMYASQMVTNAK